MPEAGSLLGSSRHGASSTAEVVDPYCMTDGVFYPPATVEHRENEYDSAGFKMLWDMQQKHFWYRGRHRFLLHEVKRYVPPNKEHSDLRMIDIGCGCGGWISDLVKAVDLHEAEVAVADSSLTALKYASQVLPDTLQFYQVDLLNLHWQNRWDVVFLLDVIEHVPDDARALAELHRALSPGGLLFITAPALSCFWTWNDELVGHQRRYSKPDFTRLAAQTGFTVCRNRYFMFLLSPLLLASRWLTHRIDTERSPEQMRELLEAMHRVPRPITNFLLKSVFFAETPLGHYAPFPWGTSILSVLRKPVAP